MDGEAGWRRRGPPRGRHPHDRPRPGRLRLSVRNGNDTGCGSSARLKRIPNLEIGDAGEVVLELWCKGGKGQFSVAGNTVIFVAGAMENRTCPADRAQADDDLIAALTEAATWKRQDDFVSFVGTRTLRFRLNTN